MHSRASAEPRYAIRGWLMMLLCASHVPGPWQQDTVADCFRGFYDFTHNFTTLCNESRRHRYWTDSPQAKLPFLFIVQKLAYISTLLISLMGLLGTVNTLEADMWKNFNFKNLQRSLKPQINPNLIQILHQRSPSKMFCCLTTVYSRWRVTLGHYKQYVPHAPPFNVWRTS